MGGQGGAVISKISIRRMVLPPGGVRFLPGALLIIGKRPTNRPYVNIEDENGRLLASIDHVEMNRLVKKWVKANGGYPA